MKTKHYNKMKLVEEVLTKAEISFQEIGLEYKIPSDYDKKTNPDAKAYLEVYVRFEDD